MITLTPDQHKIIDVAFKRFSKMGHENTTMAQIAKDLGYSRTFLYYYFPDKESIFKGALIRRSNKYFEAVEKEMKKKNSGVKTLEAVFRLKINCARDFQSLGFYTNVTVFRMLLSDPDLRYIFLDEHKYFSKILQDGIKDSTIQKCNVSKTVGMILDSIHGFMSVGLKKMSPDGKFSNQELDELSKRQLEFTSLLLQALRAN
jgi:AcrR family transcriptional regulator